MTENELDTNRRCDNCGTHITVPAFAPHKRFCSNSCRDSWHKKQRKEGLELLRRTQAKAKP